VHRIDEAQIKAFAIQLDPHPFHADQRSAERTLQRHPVHGMRLFPDYRDQYRGRRLSFRVSFGLSTVTMSPALTPAPAIPLAIIF
jgi:acyl dehydratase